MEHTELNLILGDKLLSARELREIRELYPFDPDGKAYYQRRLVHYLIKACRCHEPILIKNLLACGASLFVRGTERDTPLSMLCDSWNPARAETIDWMLTQYKDARCTLNWVERERYTPLHVAISSGNAEVCRVLVAHGANLTIENQNGRSPAQFVEVLINEKHTHEPKDCYQYTCTCDHKGLDSKKRRKRDGQRQIRVILEEAKFEQVMRAIGAWRPHKHTRFPHGYRLGLRTMLVLAKAHLHYDKKVDKEIMPKYTQACLSLLPEELLQWIYVLVVAPPIAKSWIKYD